MILALLLILGINSIAAQSDEKDCIPGDARDQCTEQRGITLDITYPAWIDNYPEIQRIVRADINRAMHNYMHSMNDSPYDYAAIERVMVFTVSYRQVIYNPEIVTLVVTEISDYGGVYPVDEIHSLTFHLGQDRQLMMADLLREGVDQEALFTPYIDQYMPPSVQGEVFAYLGERSPYETFVIADGMLTLIYPFGRIGPIHAGSSHVDIPLEDIAEYLNPELFEVASAWPWDNPSWIYYLSTEAPDIRHLYRMRPNGEDASRMAEHISGPVYFSVDWEQ